MPPLTYCEVDLGAIRDNLQSFRKHVDDDSVLLMPVVKANAYGHGAIEVAQAALNAGAHRIAVNRVVEGVQLRSAGIAGPIQVLGYALLAEMEAILDHSLIPTITEFAHAERLSELAGAMRRRAKIHIKVDTGMGRLGLLPDEAPAFIASVAKLPNLEIEGVFTHFSVADSDHPENRDYTRGQLNTFLNVVSEIEKLGIQIPLKHAANSAGTLYYPEAHLKMVRVGVSLYGLRPNAALETPFPLRPALSVKSHVARMRTLPPGSSISYGRTYTTQRETPVALVPVGYGDGIHRLLSNRGVVLIHGQRSPIVGRVCMDQMVVDISACDPDSVAVEDEVVLIGRQDEAEITTDEMASWAETINYEITTSLLPRTTRIFKNR
jgi:alanine racemase